MNQEQAVREYRAATVTKKQQTVAAYHGGSQMTRKTRVYIAGPYSRPDPCANTHAAIAERDGK